MAVTFVDGFDYYNGTSNSLTTPALSTRWRYLSPIGLATGRFGGQAVAVNFPVSVTSPKTCYTAVQGTNTGTIGFAFNPQVLIGSEVYICGLYQDSAGSASSAQLTISVTSGGLFRVSRGPFSNSLALSTIPIVANTWYYVELEYYIADTGGFVNLYVSGALVASASGVDTRNLTATDTFNIFSFGTPDSTTYLVTVWLFDDFYMTDTATRLGEQRVITSYPTSNVLTDFWSSSTSGASQYTMVDEAQCDGDTTYVASSTANSRVVFSLPSLSVPPINVNAVQIVGFARKDETQFRQIALEYQNTAGAVSTGPTYTLSGGYIRAANLYTQNPLTGTTWTATDINTMRIGARLVT